MIPFSNRGPGANGSVGVDVVADGAYALGYVTVNAAGTAERPIVIGSHTVAPGTMAAFRAGKTLATRATRMAATAAATMPATGKV